MLDNLYNDIGDKIKTLAKWIFIVEAVTAIIGGLAMLIEGYFLGGIAALVLGPIVAWVSTWILYGFGELVDKACSLNSSLYIITQPIVEEQNHAKHKAEEMAKREALERAKREAAERAKREAEELAKREAAEYAKRDAEAYARRVEEARSKPVVPKERTLAEKLEFALQYSTDEGMISCLQRIDDEAVANILKEPPHLIRGMIEAMLEKL